MTDIFKFTNRPSADLFFKRNDKHDVRMGETVSSQEADYAAAEIVILGCPQDEGVRRNNGRIGAAAAPNEIRKAFYRLTNFGVAAKIFDLGDTKIQTTLEETHSNQAAVVRRLLQDGKKIVSLGGGNDVAYPDCRALSETVGAANILAFNIDQHFDVRFAEESNSGTPYRQLLEESWIEPQNFYEIAYQPHANSPLYFDYLSDKNVNLISLQEFRELEDFNLNILRFRSDKALFWGFDVDAVRASDAPGVSASSPIGLLADEFCDLAAVAGFQSNTAIIEFSEVNPTFDVDARTAKLVAIAMHRFCQAVSQTIANGDQPNLRANLSET